MTRTDHSGGNRFGSNPAAEVSIRIGTRATFDAKMSSAGLLSVGALVSGILLSTAVVVFTAGLRKTRSPLATLPGPPAVSDAK